MDITDKRNQIQSKHQQKFTLVNKDNKNPLEKHNLKDYQEKFQKLKEIF